MYLNRVHRSKMSKPFNSLDSAFEKCVYIYIYTIYTIYIYIYIPIHMVYSQTYCLNLRHVVRSLQLSRKRLCVRFEHEVNPLVVGDLSLGLRGRKIMETRKCEVFVTVTPMLKICLQHSHDGNLTRFISPAGRSSQ